jgi:hypothetical protein
VDPEFIPTSNPSIQNPLKETYVKVSTGLLNTGDLVTYSKPKSKVTKNTGWCEFHCKVTCAVAVASVGCDNTVDTAGTVVPVTYPCTGPYPGFAIVIKDDCAGTCGVTNEGIGSFAERTTGEAIPDGWKFFVVLDKNESTGERIDNGRVRLALTKKDALQEKTVFMDVVDEDGKKAFTKKGSSLDAGSFKKVSKVSSNSLVATESLTCTAQTHAFFDLQLTCFLSRFFPPSLLLG